MFCENCGKENKVGSKFCENCGSKIVSQPEKKINKPHKPMSKKAKVIIIVSVIVLAILITLFLVLSSKYKASNVAKGYFLAVMNQDTDQLYEYLNVEDSDFTSKKIFKKVFKSEDKAELLNYSVAEEVKSNDGLSATVTINYTLKNSNRSSTEKFYLVKDKKKKWLFFDNWQISNSSSLTVDNYQVKALKDSTVKIEGNELSKKYLNKAESDDYDVYTIPKIFKGEYKATVTLKNGLELSDDFTVSSYGSANLTRLKLSDAEETALEKNLPNVIDTLYQSAMNKKEFKDIKSNYDYKGADLNDLEEAYALFMRSIGSNGLTKLKITDAKVKNSQLNYEGYLYVTVDIDYEYTLNYQLLGENKVKDGKTEDTAYLTFDYVDKDFKLVDMSSVKSYFSRF